MCNDGSPGAFYFHKASDPAQSNIWLFYLEGGDWCYDAQSCATRFKVSPQFMTTDRWPGVISLGGIMDENPRKSPWYGANKFYVGYCSSDAWVGDEQKGPDTFGLAFRGQRIISATLKVVVTKFGLGSTPGQRLLFAGCSAGSRGAMFTIDYVPGMLRDLGVPEGYVQLQGLFDSPMWVDVDPITGVNGPIVPLQEQTQAILALVNATGRLGPTCMAAFQPADWWKCLYGQYRLPFVQTPYALNAAQFDKFQLPYNEGGDPPYDAMGLAYAAGFQTAVRSALAPVPTTAQPGSAVFSAACFHHCVTQEPSFWAIKVYNVSFKDLSAAWFFQDEAPLKYVEACDGFKCGTCRSHRKHPGAPPDPRPKPPRAPAPPDPFAIWSPPPPQTIKALPTSARTATVTASSSSRGGHDVVYLLLALLILAGLTWACASRRSRRLRVMHGESALELEEDALIGGGGGGLRGRAPPRPTYYGSAGPQAQGEGAAAALSAFRSDARYARPGGGAPPASAAAGGRQATRGIGSAQRAPGR